MIARKVEKYIKDWIHSSNKALLVSGARQVGKTFTIRQCLAYENVNYLEINLIEHPEIIRFIEKSVSVDDFIVNISAVMDYSFVPGETVIFIDKVQEVKDVVTRLPLMMNMKSRRHMCLLTVKYQEKGNSSICRYICAHL